jgi:hypothetical protein
MAGTDFKYDVFISYSSANKDWVRKDLLSALEKAGLKVCIDFRDFKVGKPALKNMRDGILESRHTLLVLTDAYLKSGWTEFESLISQTLDPANRQTRVIPLLKGKCDLPIEIKFLTYVNFCDPDDWDIAWKQLLEALGTSSPDTRPPTPDTPHLTPDTWNLKHPYGLPKDFTGRVDERKMLTEWLEHDHEQPLLVMRALGGFGKSALAWYWLTHEVDKSKWTRVLWWSFYEGDASFDGFIREAYELLVGRENVPANPRVLAAQVVEALKQPHALLIMDGFERALRAFGNLGAAYQEGGGQPASNDGKGSECISPAAEEFLKNVASLGGLIQSKVLMTTRLTPRVLFVGANHDAPLQGFIEKELLQLPPADAVDFFHAQGIRGTRRDIELACEPCGFHPLSLRLLAGLVIKDKRQPLRGQGEQGFGSTPTPRFGTGIRRPAARPANPVGTPGLLSLIRDLRRGCRAACQRGRHRRGYRSPRLRPRRTHHPRPRPPSHATSDYQTSD